MKGIGNVKITADVFQSFIYAMEKIIVWMVQMKIDHLEEAVFSRELKDSKAKSIHARSRVLVHINIMHFMWKLNILFVNIIDVQNVVNVLY